VQAVSIADFSFGHAVLLMLVFFGLVVFVWLLVFVLMNLFRRDDISGWGKAGWTMLVILVPFLGILIYIIAEGSYLAEQPAQEPQRAQTQMRTDTGAPASMPSPAEKIARAKWLLDNGRITQRIMRS
jgi:hypothetical protein